MGEDHRTDCRFVGNLGARTGGSHKCRTGQVRRGFPPGQGS